MFLDAPLEAGSCYAPGGPSRSCRHTDTVLRYVSVAGVSTEGAIERFFCGTCGSMLWGEDSRDPKHIYPAASCLDIDIPSKFS